MSAAELFEPGEYLQSGSRSGWFAVLSKPGGNSRQEFFELNRLPDVVKALDPDVDTYITQASFTAANRRAVNLRDVGLLFADLDTYGSHGLAGKGSEEQADLLVQYCRQEGLPVPSVVLFSGRGLQAKWLLIEAQGPATLFEWNEAQKALVRLLETFSADRAVKDVSRVLRLDRTINTKSGERCRVVWTASGVDGCPVRYDFEELREALAVQEVTTREPEQRRKAADRPVLALPQEQNLRRLQLVQAVRPSRSLDNARRCAGWIPRAHAVLGVCAF